MRQKERATPPALEEDRAFGERLATAPPEEPARTRRLLALAAGLAALLLIFAFVHASWTGIHRAERERVGWWWVEATVESERFAPGQLVRLQVLSDHRGFLWIYSPATGLPNRVFPCPASDDGCDAIIARGDHEIAPDVWRPVPLAEVDAYGVTAGSEPGPDELIVLVTAGNDPNRALGHLIAMRPEISARAEAVRSGDWGADVLRIEVEE